MTKHARQRLEPAFGDDLCRGAVGLIAGHLFHRDLKSYSGSAGLGYALTLRRSRTPGWLNDLRLESSIEAGAEKVSTRNPLQRFSLSTGLVFRNAWGRVRLLLTYLNLARETP